MKNEIKVTISIKEAMPDIHEALLALDDARARLNLLVWSGKGKMLDAVALQRVEAILEKLHAGDRLLGE